MQFVESYKCTVKQKWTVKAEVIAFHRKSNSGCLVSYALLVLNKLGFKYNEQKVFKCI